MGFFHEIGQGIYGDDVRLNQKQISPIHLSLIPDESEGILLCEA